MNHHQNFSQQINCIEHKKVRVKVLLTNLGVLLAAKNTGATTLPSRALINFPVADSVFTKRPVALSPSGRFGAPS